MSDLLKMEYNSTKEHLIISEYGRNVQNLVGHLKTIEDKEERQKFAERIVRLMYQMRPSSISFADSKDKFWTHLFRIAEYDLDVEAPETVKKTKPEEKDRPDSMGYPERSRTFRHYGINVKRMMDEAIKMEDEEKKAAFLKVIGSYMKLAYKNWNREHYVSDEIIKADLAVMSEGKLTIDADTPLDSLAKSTIVRKKRTNHKKDNKKGKNYKRRR